MSAPTGAPVRQEWLDRLARGDPRARPADRRSAPPPLGPPGLALPARRAAGRPQQRPQHRRDRLPAVPGDAPRRRPRGAAPGRRDRVRQRHRRDERQRRLRPDARSAPGIVGHADLRLGARGARGAGGAHPRRRRALPRHPAQRRLGRRRCQRPANAPEPQPASPIRASAPASRGWRRSASPSTPGSTTRRSPKLTALARAFPETPIVLNHLGGPLGIGGLRRRSATPSSPTGRPASANWRPARTSPSSSAAWGCPSPASPSTSSRSRHPPSSSPTPAAPTSRPASRRSAPIAACSRATSRSTRSPTATPSTGTPASAWRRARATTEKADLFRRTAARFYRLELPDGM